MIIKATLEKPYTQREKTDFIVEQNHQNGYEIRETEEALEAWGYTEEEIAEQAKQSKISQLRKELEEIDMQTIRPLRAIQSGNYSTEDTDKLAELETQAEEKRQQIRDLQEQKVEENEEESVEENVEEDLEESAAQNEEQLSENPAEETQGE